MTEIPVWLWDADGPGCRLQGVCDTKERAMSVCEEFLSTGDVLSAAVELAHLRAGSEILSSYYECTGYGWSATLLNSVQHGAEQGSAPRSDVRVVWVPFDEIRERMRA